MEILIANISKAFDKKPALAEISMTVAAGEIVCLLGPSGAGKTTLIRLIMGAIGADSGEIHIGKARMPNLDILNQIGFMPQADALYDDLTGIGNMKFFAGLFGLDKGTRDERIAEAAGLVGLEDELRKYVRHYSGGMKKRLSLAIALLHDPDVLLLDEPTVGIDPLLRRSIWKRFRELRDAGKTLLVSTHVMDEFFECDKAALLYEGRLIWFDTKENLLAKTAGGRVEELFDIAASATSAATRTVGAAGDAERGGDR
jgi:ABC-2 type transport system ATP-binding protein